MPALKSMANQDVVENSGRAPSPPQANVAEAPQQEGDHEDQHDVHDPHEEPSRIVGDGGLDLGEEVVDTLLEEEGEDHEQHDHPSGDKEDVRMYVELKPGLAGCAVGAVRMSFMQCRYRPTAARKDSARSVRSQVSSGSSRPKWPLAAVLR
jgi:hypothetical protein